MFGLFSSKNQKLVQKWQKEHEKIVELAHKVLGEYAKNNYKEAKKTLKALNSLVVDHLMNEDIEFYKLMHDEKRIDRKTEVLVDDFIKSFRKTKLELMSFLSQYAKDDVPLDETFLTTFNEIIEVVAERIDFEEKNLYSKLKEG
jgi:hypothetical protein